jgi:hypothetical protein
MSELRELLRDNSEAIADRWLECVLNTYPEEAVAAFQRQKDPFANPVGHSLRVGTRAILESIIAGIDGDHISRPLTDIIKIRAVQQFTASQAVGFVFLLKDAIREQLGDAADDAPIVTELVDLEHVIDRLALVAFDLFVQCREQLFELRVNEVKRSVSWVVDKVNQRKERTESDVRQRGREMTDTIGASREAE